MASARRGPRAASVMAEPFPEPADDAPFAVGGVVETAVRAVLQPARRAGHRNERRQHGREHHGPLLTPSPRWPEPFRRSSSHPAIVASHATGAVERPREHDARVRPGGWRVGTAARDSRPCTPGRTTCSTWRGTSPRASSDNAGGAGASSHDPIAFDATHFWSGVRRQNPERCCSIRRATRPASASASPGAPRRAGTAVACRATWTDRSGGP